MKPILIEVGLNEAVGREQHPGVPRTPREIAADILEVADAGAGVVHFHARDPVSDAQRLDDTGLYREAMLEVRRSGCPVQMYPSYAPWVTEGPDPLDARFGHVLALADDPELGLQVAPLDMGSLNLAVTRDGRLPAQVLEAPLEASVHLNPLPQLARMLRAYDARGLVASLAIFEPGHLRTTLALLDAGLCTRPLLKLCLSGTWLHGPLPDPAGLDEYLRLLDALRGDRALEWICAPSGLGSPERLEALVRAAVERGGHVRVGIGDDPAAAAGCSNRELVETVVRIAAEHGRRPARLAELPGLAPAAAPQSAEE